MEEAADPDDADRYGRIGGAIPPMCINLPVDAAWEIVLVVLSDASYSSDRSVRM